MDWLTSFWAVFEPVHDNLIGLGFTLLAALIFYTFRAKVSLIYGRANNSLNVINVPHEGDPEKNSTTEIYIEKFFLQNTGRKPANDVDFVLSDFPTDISVFQPRDIKYISVEKGNCLVSIPRIAPGELVIIDCAYINKRASFIRSVKCAEALGKEVPFWTTRRFSTTFRYFSLFLMVLGMSFLVQTVINIL
ncbi:hypothetical protein [Sulfitobacter geojensis]|uniref:hypothetical protein n=1 Tax=Sulfitobacter geojensis TaxID=1342299 RepID=UPI0007D9DDE0|nr:hypothetical protein [Sulfitobacter geojensis]OAN87014.1 hypothetical protein A8B74_05125 [Sulfitobacter geojensis]